MRTATGRAMRCRNVGCKKEVRRNAATLVCSEACEVELRERCQATLDVLDGKLSAEDYPIYYRTRNYRRAS